MATATSAIGTTALKGPMAISAAVVDPTALRAILAAALLSTSAPAPAAITRYEDTALRIAPPPADAARPVERRQDLATVERIRALAAYEAGWNGPDSMAPTNETVRQAIDFARQLGVFGDIAQPYISLADDGEINFYWKTKAGLTMDLGFNGTSQYSYFAEIADGREFIEEGAELGQPLPAELIVALRA